ncbi:MAG: glycosyltransferase family 4 protein [Anaerolineales bacterium]|nr:glycosyltransferase family 4 protein [Anaerolineales bacterium]
MRFLFLSNFFPPAGRGGYEQWCQEVAEGLRNHGHDVHVLTSAHGRMPTPPSGLDWVHRELHLEMEIASLRNAFQFFTRRRARERENLARTRNLLESLQPDAALIWGMWNLQLSIPALVEERMGARAAYYMGDYWPTLPNPFEDYWNAPARNLLTGIPKAVLKPFAKAVLSKETAPRLRFERVVFPSRFMLDDFARRKVAVRDARIIYGAIDTGVYLREDEAGNDNRERISILFVGRLSEEKGVHTAIQAIGLLVRNHGVQDVRLTIVGSGEPGYESFLRNLVGEEGIDQFVRFVTAQPKESLPSLYKKADIFLFTSTWAEPFGRALVEAMASGVPVIGTSVGGAAEILIENENGLTFPPNDPEKLATRILQLVASPDLSERLAKAARETAVGKFDIRRMTDEIGAFLELIARS